MSDTRSLDAQKIQAVSQLLGDVLRRLPSLAMAHAGIQVEPAHIVGALTIQLAHAVLALGPPRAGAHLNDLLGDIHALLLDEVRALEPVVRAFQATLSASGPTKAS